MDEQSGDERTAAQDEDDQKNQAIHSNRLASIIAKTAELSSRKTGTECV